MEVIYGGGVCECVVGCLQHKSQEERTLSVLGYGLVVVVCECGSVIDYSLTLTSLVE